MSLKVKSDGVIGLPVYSFLLARNSDIWPNSVTMRDIRRKKLINLDFDLSRPPKVKYAGAGGLPTYKFLLVLTVTNYLTLLLYDFELFDLSKTLKI